MTERKTKGRPTAIDQEIGQRIRAHRVYLNLSQEKLAARTGVTFQQIQKYENGTNRVSASRLVSIAHALGVPVEYFYGRTAAPAMKIMADRYVLMLDEGIGAIETTVKALKDLPAVARDMRILRDDFDRQRRQGAENRDFLRDR